MDGQPCPICSLGGTLQTDVITEAQAVDDTTVVVHGVPVYVCDRCGYRIFDESTTRALEGLYRSAVASTSDLRIVDYGDLVAL